MPVSKEDRILGQICLLDPRASNATRQLFDAGSIDWTRLFARAKREGLLNLLFLLLRSSGMLDAVAAQARRDAENCYYVSSLKNCRIKDETQKILETFRAGGIQALTLKGVFMAETVYGDLSARPISDIDVLIRHQDLGKADALLRGQGYAPPPHFSDFASEKRRAPINSLMFNRIDEGLCLDLHWHIVNSTWPLYAWVSEVDIDAVWKAAEEVCVGKVAALGLCPHHQVVFLCCHAMQHCFDSALHLTDIVRTIKFYGQRLDWDAVFSTAEKWRMLRLVRTALRMAALRIPFALAAIDRRLQPGKAADAGIRALSWSPASRYVLAYLLGLFSEDTFAARMRYLKETFLPSALIMAHNQDMPESRVRRADYLLRFFLALRSVFRPH